MLDEEEIFYSEGGETLKQFAQRSCTCHLPGDIQKQIGCGPEKPDLMDGNPVYRSMFGIR